MNLSQYASKQLKETEELVHIVRRHALTMVPGVLLGTLLVAANFFLLAWWFRWQGWGALGFFIWLIIGGALIGRAIYIWSMNAFIITNQRIIDINQLGFFQRTVSEASYDKIQDVRYTIKGFWRTILRLGTIEVQTAGSTINLELSGVPRPQEMQQLITNIQQQTRTPGNQSGMSAAELIEVIDQLKSKLSPEEFTALVESKRRAAHKE